MIGSNKVSQGESDAFALYRSDVFTPNQRIPVYPPRFDGSPSDGYTGATDGDTITRTLNVDS